MPTCSRTALLLRGVAAVGALLALVAGGCSGSSDRASTSVASSPASTVGGTGSTAPGTSASADTDGRTAGRATSAPPTAAPTTAAATGAAPTTGRRPLRDLPVASATYTFVDSSRPTVTSSGTRVSDVRTLPTTVWYPAEGKGPWPLVVFGHGYQVGPGPYARICEKWASAGYVVAAPSFELSDESRAGPNLDEADMVNQPADMSFVLTQLIARSRLPEGADALSGKVDATRLAAAGHSDGASEALGMGYHPSLVDHRIRAVVALSADPFPNLDTASGSAVLLDVHGDADTVTPFANSGRIMDQIQARRFQLVLHGADHLPPVVGGTEWTPTLDAVTIDFLDHYLAGRTATDDVMLADGDQPGIASITARS